MNALAQGGMTRVQHDPLMFTDRVLPVDPSGSRFIGGIRAENCCALCNAPARRRDVEIDAVGADHDDAIQKLRGTAYEAVLDASFAPSHATPPPHDQLEKKWRLPATDQCRWRLLSLPPLLGAGEWHGPAFTLGAVSRSAPHRRRKYFRRSMAKTELMNSIICREVSFHE
ncbi:hypothetical protein [Mesorhizobium sp. LNHC209A00]|uniref:hypothetical protein n=1 Tax=Mesorhizobium TaxID=68287 RepID=UPI0012EC3755|nr:hypothetical protein [Mesorhizobium sp. LNHC209A00]